jgi:hypothetical protein
MDVKIISSVLGEEELGALDLPLDERDRIQVMGRSVGRCVIEEGVRDMLGIGNFEKDGSLI